MKKTLHFNHIYPSYLQKILDSRLSLYNIQLWIKRDDLLHPLVHGNKWRKLKYNLQEAKAQGKTHLVSFGGAFSNHIHALAAAGNAFGFETTGIIRGEKTAATNSTLSYAKKQGMQLLFVSREQYRNKETSLQALSNQLPLSYYLIPEGGTNKIAIQGTQEIIFETFSQIETNSLIHWCVSCGTGGTFTGMMQGLAGKHHLHGFSSLKGDFLSDHIKNLIQQFELKSFENWSMHTKYHFGGYAKFNDTLINFINDFKIRHHISLDPIYTGKMLYGIFDLIDKGYFSKGSQIVAVHTGGLQGISGFNQRNGNLIET